MDLYILRHGQTDYNLNGKFQGQVDVPLNENGINQSKHVQKQLKNIYFNMVISSPLARTIETAKIVSKDDIVIDERIIERSFGKLEGKYSIENYEEKIEQYNIESMDSVNKRVYYFLSEIIERYYNMENILIVTHECIAKSIESYFNKNSSKEYRLFNGKYKKYTIMR